MKNVEGSTQEETEKLQQRQGIREQHKEQVIAFGRELRRLRKKAGLTQAATAAAVGVSTGYIALLEGGKRNVPRQDLLHKMLRAYGIRHGHHLFQKAERLSTDEHWDLSEAEREIESQARIGRVPLLRLQRAVAASLDQIDVGLREMEELLPSGEPGEGASLFAGQGSEHRIFINVQDSEVHPLSVARALAQCEAFSSGQGWSPQQPPDEEAVPSVQLVMVAPKFDVDALQLAKHLALALDLKLVRWIAFRPRKGEEIRLRLKEIQIPAPDSLLLRPRNKASHRVDG